MNSIDSKPSKSKSLPVDIQTTKLQFFEIMIKTPTPIHASNPKFNCLRFLSTTTPFCDSSQINNRSYNQQSTSSIHQYQHTQRVSIITHTFEIFVPRSSSSSQLTTSTFKIEIQGFAFKVQVDPSLFLTHNRPQLSHSISNSQLEIFIPSRHRHTQSSKSLSKMNWFWHIEIFLWLFQICLWQTNTITVEYGC